jgi:hypothetical protein
MKGQVMVESIELRRLLAALTPDGIADGTRPDDITLRLLSDGRVQVLNGGTAAIKVEGSSVGSGASYSRGGIDRVVVNLPAGRDSIDAGSGNGSADNEGLDLRPGIEFLN